jgi:DNA-binding IclR family transcriptional regulator
VDLAVWTNEGVLFVDQVRTLRPFRPVSRVGRVFSDFKNAHIKVFLAFMPEEERAQLLARSPEPEKLAKEIEKVVAEGVAFDVQEQAEGVCGVAAPILDTSGRARASISVVTPATRFGPSDVVRLTEAVTQAASAISHDMGFE